jgi:biotin transport system permease protein/energy-coupling factor transport system permease protein
MVSIGRYIAGESFVHQMDPRVKIISIIVLSLVILSGELFILSALSALLFLTVLLSRLPMRGFYETLRPTAFFLLFLFLLHLFFTPGRPLPFFPLWKVTVTHEGLWAGLQITWRFALLLMWAATLTMTTPPSEMIGGIERIFRPFRFLGVPSHDIALMVSMAVRFVPVLREQIDTAKTAQLARGADFATGSLRRRSRAVSRLMWPVIAGTIRRADHLATAIEARGYSGRPRTLMREMRLSNSDYTVMAVISGMVLVQWVWG